MKCHLYVESWLHCLLASLGEGPEWVASELSKYYTVRDYHPLKDETDSGYLVETESAIICAVSGTRGEFAPWRDNFRILFPKDGVQRGWYDSWIDLFATPLERWLIKSEKPVLFFGHSRGDSVSTVGALWARDVLEYPDVEQVGYCGPEPFDRHGIKRCKKAKLCRTRLFVGNSDIVDNIGLYGIFGKHYGFPVKLPTVTTNLIMGHDYPNVHKSLFKLMSKWGDYNDLDTLTMFKKYLTIRDIVN